MNVGELFYQRGLGIWGTRKALFNKPQRSRKRILLDCMKLNEMRKRKRERAIMCPNDIYRNYIHTHCIT